MSAVATDPIWVNDNAELRELCEQWRQQAAIALDTEFIRTSTFYPKAALIQVGDGRGCYLLDPLALSDWGPFCDVLQSPSVTKIMHSCSEDFEVFQRFLGVIPSPLFDTQRAAAYAGLDYSMGYARLVQTLLNIDLPKGETRSDWLQRPLSVPQLRYAALDVAYLPVIYGLLVSRLRELKRLPWLQQDCEYQVQNALVNEPFDHYYTKVKLAWKLEGVRLLALQKLSAWREDVCRKRDVPRNRVIKENILWDISAKLPTDLRQLRNIQGLGARTIDQDGEALLRLIEEAKAAPNDQWPPALPAPLSVEAGKRVKRLKAAAGQIAERLGVPIELLAARKDYEKLVRDPAADNDNSLLMNGWRRERVYDPLKAVLTSKN